MDKYQDKEAAMDDYSHEKKLGADARWDMEHGRGRDAGADIDHAHALKKDAYYDAKHRKAAYLHKTFSHKPSCRKSIYSHDLKTKDGNFDSSTDEGIATLYTAERKGE